MRIFVLSCVFGIVLLCGSVSAKEWRGLVPLHSTRSDVEAILGKPEDPTKKHLLVYRTDNEIALIDYADDRPCGPTGGWRVPPGTVTSITVSPKLEQRLSDLHLDERKYKKVHDPDMPPDRFMYVNKEEGESIDVFQGKVITITYSPLAEDDYLRCPGSRSSAESNYHPIDTYRDLSFKYEKQRLDNLAIHLQQKPEAIGYIIVYARHHTRPGVARARARRARKHLVNVRGIDARRVVVIFGGYRQQLTTELYLLPRDLPPPIPSPTIGTSKVQFNALSSIFFRRFFWL